MVEACHAAGVKVFVDAVVNHMAGGDAIVFIDNHDTQRNGRSPLIHTDGAPYAVAEAFMRGESVTETFQIALHAGAVHSSGP